MPSHRSRNDRMSAALASDGASATTPAAWIDHAARWLAVALGLFVLWTAAAGPFESLIQRAIFLSLTVCLGVLVYPLGRGRSWRPAGAAVDAAIAGRDAGRRGGPWSGATRRS